MNNGAHRHNPGLGPSDEPATIDPPLMILTTLPPAVSHLKEVQQPAVLVGSVNCTSHRRPSVRPAQIDGECRTRTSGTRSELGPGRTQTHRWPGKQTLPPIEPESVGPVRVAAALRIEIQEEGSTAKLAPRCGDGRITAEPPSPVSAGPRSRCCPALRTARVAETCLMTRVRANDPLGAFVHGTDTDKQRIVRET